MVKQRPETFGEEGGKHDGEGLVGEKIQGVSASKTVPNLGHVRIQTETKFAERDVTSYVLAFLTEPRNRTISGTFLLQAVQVLFLLKTSARRERIWEGKPKSDNISAKIWCNVLSPTISKFLHSLLDRPKRKSYHVQGQAKNGISGTTIVRTRNGMQGTFIQGESAILVRRSFSHESLQLLDTVSLVGFVFQKKSADLGRGRRRDAARKRVASEDLAKSFVGRNEGGVPASVRGLPLGIRHPCHFASGFKSRGASRPAGAATGAGRPEEAAG